MLRLDPLSTPLYKNELPEWKQSFQYLTSWELSLKHLSKMRDLVTKIAHSESLKPTSTNGFGKILDNSIGSTVQFAGIGLSADEFMESYQKEGLSLKTAEKGSEFTSKSMKLVGRLAKLTQYGPANKSEFIEMVYRISQAVSLALSTEKLSDLYKNSSLGLDLASLGEVARYAEKGTELAAWVSQIQQLGMPIRVFTSLTSVNLALACFSPTISLLIHLREEGYNAFGEKKIYDTSYKMGVALLAIYLYLTAITVSVYLELAIAAAGLALSLY